MGGSATGGWRIGSAPAIHARDEVHVTATWRDLLMVCWQRAPTLAALDDVHGATRRLLELHPDGVGVFGIAQAGMPMIGSAERRRAADLLKDFGPRIRFVASVIEGEGFWAGTTRSVMTAITLMARPPCPVKIFARVENATGWMAPRMAAPAGTALGAVDVERAITFVRRQLPSPA